LRLKVALMVPVAGVLGFIAVQAGRHWVDRQVNERLREASALNVTSPALEPTTSFGTIVVAAAPLRFGTELTPANVREIPWPQGLAPKDSFAKISDLFNAPGKRLVVAAMDDNEPVMAAKITGAGQRANLAAILDDGMKAITVRVDEVVGVAGFVLPGDRVDVLLTRETEKNTAFSDLIMQNLKVLAIDQANDDRSSKPTVSRTVTLEVATDQAQRLVVAQRVGALTLALRPLGLATTETAVRVTSADLLAKRSAAPKTSDDIPVASFDPASVTVGVIRNMTRQEYSVPTKRKE
jgi:pilus assembly protein CpaB